MIRVEWEPIARLLDDGIEDLTTRHWSEVALDQDVIPLAPDWARMAELEASGTFKILGARRSGRLVGYSAFLIAKSLHYRLTTHALNDVIFVDPDERAGGPGLRLIRRAEQLLTAEVKPGEIIKILYHTKLHTPVMVGDILGRIGYSKIEEIWSRTLRA